MPNRYTVQGQLGEAVKALPTKLESLNHCASCGFHKSEDKLYCLLTADGLLPPHKELISFKYRVVFVANSFVACCILWL